jgi:hypothetical protein
MRIQAFICGVALALTACTTTISRGEGFSGEAGVSYVVIVADGMRTGAIQTHDFTLQRVDLTASVFLREFAYVRFGHKHISGGGDEFPKPEMMAASFRFAGRKLAPGDYALVVHEVYDSLGTMAMRQVNCYSHGAAIYRFREGAINIVRLGPSFDLSLRAIEVTDPAPIEMQVTQVLASYPKMTAPRVVAKLLGSARFDGGKKTCNTSGRFSFTRLPGVSVDW